MPEATDEIGAEESHSLCLEQNKGVLHEVKFQRVVLDEAHEIKNHKSKRAKAVMELQAKFHWAVTGTPVQNHLGEFYAYFLFLRVPGHGTYAEFSRNYAQSDDIKSMKRLLFQLGKWTIRRTHADQCLGSKLLTLPDHHRHDMAIPMSPLEKGVYCIVEKRFLELVNGLSVNEQTELSGNSYRTAIVLLLRLRQLTAHPLLIQDCIRDLLQPEDFEQLRNLIQNHQAAHETDAAVMHHLRVMLQNPARLPTLVDSGSSDIDGSSQSTPSETTMAAGGAYGTKNALGAYLNVVELEQQERRSHLCPCPYCGKAPIKSPQLTSCGHVYCFECTLRMSFEALNSGQEFPLCVSCKQLFTGSSRFDLDAPDHFHSTTWSEETPTRPKMSKIQAMKNTIKRWVDVQGNIVHSTKTLAIKAQILAWLEEDPECKIIIYTLFRPM